MSAWKQMRAHRREGDLDGGRSTPPRVDRLLDSARAPGTSRELAREDDATMLFHRAHLERVHTARRESTMPIASPRTGLKAAIASAGAVLLMSTGVAFAASGHAPWSGAQASGRPTTIPSHSHPTDDPSETSVDDPSESGDPTAPGDTGSAAPDAHAYPGLCRAYAAGQKTEHGAALSSPAFAALVAAAGSADAVSGFCASLAPEPTHPAAPTHPASPTHPVVPTHPSPTHPTPTHTAPSHPTSTSHPGSGDHPQPDSHPSRP
jgi:hypothetical protein